jgi:hypothetical protein
MSLDIAFSVDDVTDGTEVYNASLIHAGASVSGVIHHLMGPDAPTSTWVTITSSPAILGLSGDYQNASISYKNPKIEIEKGEIKSIQLQEAFKNSSGQQFFIEWGHPLDPGSNIVQRSDSQRTVDLNRNNGQMALDYATYNRLGIDGLHLRILNMTDSTPAVPEPATWALMILGLGAVGYALRRRQVRYRGAQLV